MWHIGLAAWLRLGVKSRLLLFTHANTHPTHPAPASAAAAARMSFIAQLEAVGGLAHWAVYAALHIPDAAERARVSGAC